MARSFKFLLVHLFSLLTYLVSSASQKGRPHQEGQVAERRSSGSLRILFLREHFFGRKPEKVIHGFRFSTLKNIEYLIVTIT